MMKTDRKEADIIFLEKLYGECDKGFLYLWVLQTKKTYWFKPFQLEKMRQEAINLAGKGQDVYFGVGIARDPKFKGRASSADIIGIPGIWADIDVKGKEHVKKDLPQTVEEVLAKLPLEPSIIVNSGHGLHVYFLFKEYWYFDDEREAARAQKLLQGFQLFIKQRLGYKLDSTHDLARVLRLPETMNYKSEPTAVTILKENEIRYNPDDLEQFCIESENLFVPDTTRTAGFERRPTDKTVNELLAHCKFIRHCKENAATLSYGEWLAMISNVARCKDGEKAVHEFSRPYPKYSEKETDGKIIECLSKMHGPQGCDYIRQNTLFTGCPAGGCGVKAPCSFALSTKSGSKADESKPAAKTGATPLEALTDLGNAERFTRMFGDRLKYCHQFGTWLIWDGMRHKIDETEQIMQFAKKAVRSFHEDMKTYAGTPMYEKIQKHAIRSESLSRLRAMLELSQHMLAVHVNDLDSNNWLLNVQNGTVDLKTGRLLPHDKERMITKLAPIKYDEKADCPQFKKFMQDVFADNPEIIPFMQKYFGYSLTGDTSEQIMAFSYGAMGSNGKSTLMELFMDMLGDYGETAASDTFILKRSEGIPNDIARLRGARFVKISELKQNSKMNEALLKQVTGNDKITARFLRQEYFSYLPTFKLMILTNHKPKLTGDDPALWRRIILVPFLQRFDGERKDKKLPEKLRQEYSGILNWCIKGCLKWQKEGLAPPASVLQATRQYQEESDVINNWMEDCCITAPNIVSKTTDLFNSYEQWCKENAEYISLPRRTFTNKLVEKGFKPYRTAKARCIIGIGLLDRVHEENDLYTSEEPY